MNQAQFIAFCAAGPVLLDGATGTNLQKAGMPAGVCPEQWILDHPGILADLQLSYLRAGSSILYTYTLGANRIKLGGYKIPDSRCTVINRDLALISTAVRDQWLAAQAGQDTSADSRSSTGSRTILVAGDLAPTGLFLAPAGDLSFDDLVDVYQQQAAGLLQAGVDLFVVETMIDLAQARAAVLAIQSVSDLPIMASLTFEENGRTLSGNHPLECLLTLASMGVSAFGMNCSFGPEKLADLLLPLIAVSPIPLLVKPNAGMPRLVDGETVFPMDPFAFAAAMQPMLHAGITLLGGCCGTGPEHLACLFDLLRKECGSGSEPREIPASADWSKMICSSRQSRLIDSPDLLPVIVCHDPARLADDLTDILAEKPAAVILDLSACPAGLLIDQLGEALEQVQMMAAVPLIFRDPDRQRLKKLLRIYHGRAGILATESDVQASSRDISAFGGAVLFQLPASLSESS